MVLWCVHSAGQTIRVKARGPEGFAMRVAICGSFMQRAGCRTARAFQHSCRVPLGLGVEAEDLAAETASAWERERQRDVFLHWIRTVLSSTLIRGKSTRRGIQQGAPFVQPGCLSRGEEYPRLKFGAHLKTKERNPTKTENNALSVFQLSLIHI